MRVVFRVTTGQYSGRLFLLRPGETIKVGRTEWADFCVPYDERMSGVHFNVECGPSACRLQDLESTNGTMVNGKRTTATVLLDGDEIVAGRTTFRVELESSPTIEIAKPAIVSEGIESAVSPPKVEIEPSPILVTVSERTADILPALLQISDTQRPYREALANADSEVRRAAMMAAVWSRQRWLLEYCRAIANRPNASNWTELSLLAILGQPSDLERILGIGRSNELGSRRFQIFSSYGHPRVVRDLLVAMESKDPNTAVAAGKAFTKITGVDVNSEDRSTLSPEGEEPLDELEKELLPQEYLPDPKKAQKYWNDAKDGYMRGIRWRRGIEVSQAVANGILGQLDMEARWECYLRARYEGDWNGRLSDVLRFRPAKTSS